MDPARAVEMGQPLADARDQPAAIVLGHARVDQVPQTARGPLHDQHDRALQGGVAGVGEDERPLEADQPGMAGPAPELDLAAGGLHDPAHLARRESGGRHDLECDVGGARRRGGSARPARPARPARTVGMSAGTVRMSAGTGPMSVGTGPMSVGRSRRVHRGPAPGADEVGDHPVPDTVAGWEWVRPVAVRGVGRAVRRSHRAACRSRPPAPVRGGSSARCSSRTSPNRSASPTISSRLPLRRSPLPGSWAPGAPMRSFSSAR